MWRYRILCFVIISLKFDFGRTNHDNQTVEPCPNRKFGDACRFDCHCQLSTSCGREDGTCFYGCLPNYSGPGCQLVKLTGSAEQSYTRSSERIQTTCRQYNSYYYQSRRRCIDYNYKTVSYAANLALATSGDCAQIHRQAYMYPANQKWWRLNMNGDYVVTSLKFNITDDADIRIGPHPSTTSYSNSLCESVKAGTRNVTCRPARRGRYVGLLFKNNAQATKICRVEVHGYKYIEYCPWGRFGPACVHQCSCMISNERCHHVDGSCRSGCKAGQIGYGCDVEFQMTSSVVVYPDGEDVWVDIPEFKYNIDSQRGGIPIHYRLEIYNKVWRQVEKEASSRHVKVTDLEPYREYKVRVILARHTVGNVIVRGPPGPETTFISPCGAPAKGPVIKMVETEIADPAQYPSAVNATIIWKPVSPEYANCERVGTYLVSYRAESDDDWIEEDVAMTVGLSIMQTTIEDLEPNTLYEFRLGADNGGNETNLTAITYGDVVFSRTPDGMFGPIRNLTIDADGTSARLAWLAPNDTDTEGEVTGYRVEYSEYEIVNCSKVVNAPRTETSTTEEITLVDLKPNRKYNVSICTMGKIVCGLKTLTKVETKGKVANRKPSQAAVTGILATSARVQFDHLPCHLRFGEFRRFQARLVQKSEPNVGIITTFKTQQTVYDMKGLRANTLYSLSYCWVNSYGEGPYSEETMFTTGIDVPGPPIVVDYVSTPRTVCLLWKQPLITNGRVDEYEINCILPGVHRLSEKQSVKPTTANRNATLYHAFDGAILPKRLYQCKVRGFTSAGPGQWSPTKHVRTFYRNNFAPRNFTATLADGNTTLSLQWEEPFIKSGILGYKARCDSNSTSDLEPLLQKNIFVGQNETRWQISNRNIVPDNFTCQLSTYLPNGLGKSVYYTPGKK